MATSTATVEGPETRDAARRAVERMRESIAKAEHVRDEVIDRTKREPVRALALTFAAGIALGVVLSWSRRRPATQS